MSVPSFEELVALQAEFYQQRHDDRFSNEPIPNLPSKETYFAMGYLRVARWFSFGLGNGTYQRLKREIESYERQLASYWERHHYIPPLDSITGLTPEQKELVDACAWERIHGVETGERAVRKVFELYGIHVPDLPERMQAGEKLVQWHFELRRRSYESLAAEFQTGNP